MGIRNFLKSRSIRANIMISFVLLSILFIGGTGGLSYLLFKRAGDQTITDSVKALEDQITANIGITAEKNAEIIYEKLSSAEAMVRYQSSELEYIFSDENRYGPRSTYYDYVFEYDLPSRPADTAYDDKYGIDVSYDYSSYYFEGSDDLNYTVRTSLESATLDRVASMDYVFKSIMENAPEFRWLYVAFELLDVDLFINYPGSNLMDDHAYRSTNSYEPHTEPWYLDVEAGNGDIVFTEPYFDEIDEIPLITIGRQAYFDQNGS
ncbi:MAG: hypothetical protein ACTSSH_08305, partial [Candidatus Heimdallarchaeota archaeon]